MSLVVSGQTPASVPTTSLQAALKLFENELNKEQKQIFFQSNRTLTQSDVVVFIAEIDAANQNSRRSVSSRLFTFLDAAQQFVGVVDTFIQSNPTIAALIWGGIKTSLVIANNKLGYFDQVTRMITDIGKLSPTYKEFGQLYQNDHLVQTVLCDYYASIIRICTAIVKLYKRQGFVTQLLSSFEVQFKPLLQELEKDQKRLHVCLHLASQKLISESAQSLGEERKANSIYRRAAARFQSSSLQEQSKIRTTLINDHRQQVLDNFSKLGTRQIWSMIQAQRVSGTAEWFIQEPAFESWHQSADTSILWCSGNMGVGKSVLVSSIVAYLERTYSTGICVSHHFCQTGHDDTLTARGVLGSITRQLLAGSINRLEDDQLQVILEKSRDMSIDDFADALKHYLEPSLGISYFIIIDGLDECSEPEIETILRQLKRMTEDTRFCFRLLYSCRPDLDNTVSKFLSYNARLIVSKERIQPDVETFIQFTVEQEKLQVKHPELFLRIVEVLEENHGGMFLWVLLFVDELCAQNNEAGIASALDHPPTGIRELYSRKLARIRSHKLSKNSLDVLRFTGVARRPLKIEEIREALSVELGQRDFDFKRLPNDMNRIIRACSGLIHIDEGTESLLYIHSSLYQYLFESPEQVEGFNSEEVNLHFSSVCLTYLNYQNFTKQVTSASKTKAPFQPVDIILAQSQFQSSKVLNSKLVQKLLRSRKSGTSVDLQLLNSLFQDEASDDSFQFDFFQYVSEHWLQQIKNMVPIENADFWKRLHRCINNQNLNQYKPWLTIDEGSLNHLNPADDVTLWALTNKHNSLLFHQIMYMIPDMGDEMVKQTLEYAMEADNGLTIAAVRKCLEITGTQERIWYYLAKLGWSRADGHTTLPENSANFDILGTNGQTPLCWSSYNGHLGTVMLLLAAGSNVNPTEENEETPLHRASRSGHIEVVKVLLKAGANINATNKDWKTPLYQASSWGHLETVKVLLMAGANINNTTKVLGDAPLHRASLSGHIEVVKTLLKAGANVDADNINGETPLQYASYGGHLQIVKVLLEAGADIHASANNHWTPLHEALSRGHLATAKVLLEAGANIHAFDDNHWTPLHEALLRGDLEMVKVLLEAGADVDTFDNNDWTPLHEALSKGHLEIVKILIKAGARIDVVDKDGETPLHEASLEGHLEIVKILLEAGASINATNKDGETPLHEASLEGHLEIVKVLLAAGADASVEDINGATAQVTARNRGHKNIEKILKQHRPRKI